MPKLIRLQKLKEELLEKLKDPSSTYSDYVEITERLRCINAQIVELKKNENQSEK